MDLNSLDLKELKKLEAEVRNRIATYEDRKIAEARAVLEAKAKELGFSLSALVDGGKKGGAINRMSAMKPSDLMKIAGTKKNELPMRKEEAEQMDELSKSTMGSYIKKAAADVAKKSAATDPAAAADRRAAHRMSLMRRVGIEKATDKLTKEDAVMKAIKSMKTMKAKESTSY